eukprot:4678430-Prorocentrum_lima.AAC.1
MVVGPGNVGVNSVTRAGSTRCRGSSLSCSGTGGSCRNQKRPGQGGIGEDSWPPQRGTAPGYSP